MSVEFLRTQNTIGGGGFPPDPFLDLNGAVTTPTLPKTSKIDSKCLSNGDLAGAIIATLILSAFIAFLTWFTYLRPKFQELHYQLFDAYRKISSISRSPSHRRSSNRKLELIDDSNLRQLPLDVIDCKFGTFPFRQSQISNSNGHVNRLEWFSRISSSFRSVNMDQNSQMIDIELLEPTFSGLNFSITGNMRAGIFVKEILNKGQTKSNRLKTGDRIMALTVCFESIVYEDALTILSYASPYPVILRIQRPTSPIKVHMTNEKRPATVNLSNKVKWREDFEHYDEESSRSYISPNRPPITTTQPISTPKTIRPTPKKINTQPRTTNRSSTTTKGNRTKTSSNSILATSDATNKRTNNDVKRYRTRENLPRSNPIISTSTMPATKTSRKISSSPIINNKKPVKSVTDAVMSYLHYKGVGGEHSSDAVHHSETTIMPYYDSPYDYYYGGQVSQYQYLHQTQLNRNNNNSQSAETLTAVTPNLTTSVYTLHLTSVKSTLPFQRRCERRLSSPAIITSSSNNDNLQERITSMENLDTFV